MFLAILTIKSQLEKQKFLKRLKEKYFITIFKSMNKDAKISVFKAGASLNLGVSYYPGVITVAELDEPRKKLQ